jgi:glyoxylase-like metal-dependent hydrolase (beta-lactamase superfamily II)
MPASGGTIRHPFETPPPEGEAIEVAEGVFWLRLPLPMKLDHVNVYALADDDGWTIVDTGFYSRRSVKLWQKIMAGPLGGKPVARVVLTHHHPDHVGMAGWFKREHGAEIIATRTAWLMARMLTLDVQDVYTPEAMAYYKGAGMHPEVFEKRVSERPFNFADVVHPIPVGYTRIREGDSLTLAGRVWDVRIGNGHAPEHATLWSRGDNLVLAGDQILPGISPNLGVYPTEPEADPVGEWIAACEGLRAHATDAHLTLPGHKLPFYGLTARLTQLIENHHSALDRLEAFLDRPRTAVDCFEPLFMRTIGEGEYGLALVEAVGHLNHLHGAGKAERAPGPDGAWHWTRRE